MGLVFLVGFVFLSVNSNSISSFIHNADVGSEIHLYGDTGPAYGAYSLQLDQGTPDLRSAYFPALAVGPAHYLYSLRNLTEGRHELVITNLGTREGLVEGDGFLLDYVLVTQRVGPVSG